MSKTKVMNQETQISLQGISKQYRLYNSDTGRLIDAMLPFRKKHSQLFTALHNIDLEVGPGEIVGIIGRNGSGKSTLLRIVAGITIPTEGRRIVSGSIIPLFELGAGFNRDLTGRENLHYFTIMQGFDKSRAGEIIDKAIEFADIGHFIDQPLRTYSRGMRSRLAFSISIFIDADILVIDEVLAVGDAYFKQKSQEKMRELLTSGKTILLVTHSTKEVESICTRAILMENGKLALDGKPEEVIEKYQPMQKKQQNSGRKNPKGRI
jgi:ABC-type polysaccharide/polyol phosphate transport system ATPase subunit